jgi:hypothetical protein
LMSFDPRPGPSSAKYKVIWLTFFNYLCNFLYEYTLFIELKLYILMYRNIANYNIILLICLAHEPISIYTVKLNSFYDDST